MPENKSMIQHVEKLKLVKPGNTRVTGKEQFYTPSQIALSVIERACRHIDNPKSRVFLEPAGGTGTFIGGAQEFGFENFVSMDIEPKHPLVQKSDFLQSDLNLQNAVCITNPPFGRNNSLSVPFFNKAAAHSDLIAFIVPRSWRKWSVLNRLDLGFELVDDWNLEIDYVNDQGMQTHGVGNLRTCVQVWRRAENFLRVPIKIPDYGVIEKTTPQLADVSLTLFGYGCGTVKENFPRVPNTTQTFLKLNHPRALEALKAVDFSKFFNHTAFTEALGMQEINYLINEYLGLGHMDYSLDPLNENYLGLNHAKQVVF